MTYVHKPYPGTFFLMVPQYLVVWPWPVIQAGRPKKSFLFGHIFSHITNAFCAKKAGGTCLYMPQDGHWLASFEVIRYYTPPQKS